jgi:hypothetical protein
MHRPDFGQPEHGCDAVSDEISLIYRLVGWVHDQAAGFVDHSEVLILVEYFQRLINIYLPVGVQQPALGTPALARS